MEWPRYCHDLANTRTQPGEKGLGPAGVTGLKPLWVFSTSSTGGGTGFDTTPVVYDGCVFIGSFGGTAYAFDAKTGHVVWQRKLDAPSPGSGGVVVGAAADYGPEVVPGRRVDGAVRDRVQPIDRRGDLEERAICAAALEQRRPGRLLTDSSPIVANGYILAGWSRIGSRAIATFSIGNSGDFGPVTVQAGRR